MEFIQNLNDNEYDLFASSVSNRHFSQTSSYKDIKNLSKQNNCFCIGVKDGDKVIAASLAAVETRRLFKRLYLCKGPIIDYHNQELVEFFFKNIKKLAKEYKVDYIEIEPNHLIKISDHKNNIIEDNPFTIEELTRLGYKHTGYYKGFHADVMPRFSTRLTLANTMEEFYNKLSSKKKSVINKNDKLFHVEVVEGKIEDLKYLVDYREQLSKLKGFTLLDYNYYKSCYDAFYPNCKIYLAMINFPKVLEDLKDEMLTLEAKIETSRKSEAKEYSARLENIKKTFKELDNYYQKHKVDNFCLAIAMNYFVDDIVYNMYLHTEKELEIVQAATLLHYYMYKDSKELGYKYYDLHGIPGSVERGHFFYGLQEFKLQFSGDILEYIGSFTKVVSFKYYLKKMIKRMIKRMLNRGD